MICVTSKPCKAETLPINANADGVTEDHMCLYRQLRRVVPRALDHQKNQERRAQESGQV